VHFCWCNPVVQICGAFLLVQICGAILWCIPVGAILCGAFLCWCKTVRCKSVVQPLQVQSWYYLHLHLYTHFNVSIPAANGPATHNLLAGVICDTDGIAYFGHTIKWLLSLWSR